ncbi:hypothetical protein KCU95_g2323, partial [Aureobasidium melanogenum]
MSSFSIDTLPTELVTCIGSWLDSDNLPAFRSTGRLARDATRLDFKRDCFRSMNISVNQTSLQNLKLAVTHPEFGPCIQKISYYISGTEDLNVNVFDESWAVFKALAARQQQVIIQVCVNAMAITDSAIIETRISRFFAHVVRLNTQKRFAKAPIILTLPSPPRNPNDAPSRSLLFNNLAVMALKDNINLMYSDTSSEASVTYKTNEQTLMLRGLDSKHLWELRYFFAGLPFTKINIQDSQLDTDSLRKLCSQHLTTISKISIKNVSLWDRWSYGDTVPASWRDAIEMMLVLPGLVTCNLFNLRSENTIPTWDDTSIAAQPVQISVFTARGIATVRHRLENLLATTQW